MIVIIDKSGQLCNRLWAYSPFIAYCIKNNRKLYILNFSNYHTYFEDLNKFKNIHIGIFKSLFSYKTFQFFLRLFRFLRIHKLTDYIQFYTSTFKDTHEINRALSKKRQLVFIVSWHQPLDGELMTEYKEELKHLFTPGLQTVNEVNKLLDKKKTPDIVIVGVHLRRGDYKSFQNGRYYYEDKTYLDKMNALQDQLKNKGFSEILFLLCSDSKIDTENYKSVNTIRFDNPSAIKDLYALSKCDYLIGPPSTFSMWASYYGDVPLHFVKSPEEKIELSDFSTIIAQNKFKNGRVFTEN